MVFYFTGTGNSQYIAEKIAKALGEPLYSVNDAIKNNIKSQVTTGGRVILVVPTYAWRIPRIVKDWFMSADLTGAEQVWFVMNCGDEIGNAAKYNRQLAGKKHLSYMGTAQVVMPENYIALFETPGEEKARNIIRKAQPDIDKVIMAIKEGKEFPAPRNNLSDRLKSSLVNMIFYPVYVKADDFTVKDDCTGCGKCANLCPLNNVRIENGKPLWGKDCTHCMACISYCPVEAIEYGKHSEGLRRYHM